MSSKRKNADVRARFGDRIRQLRDGKGLTQEDLADLCDLDRTYISGIERGQRNLALQNIEALALAFDLTLSELFENV